MVCSRQSLLCISLMLVAVSFVLAMAMAPAGENFQIPISTIDSGGETFSSGDDFRLGGTVGQPDAGQLSGSTYVLGGGFWMGGAVTAGSPITGVGHPQPEDPADLPSHRSAPNPFVDVTTLSFDLPEQGLVRAEVYDVTGRQVATLHDGVLGVGRHAVSWNGSTPSGRAVSGTYWLRVDAGGRRFQQKVTLLR